MKRKKKKIVSKKNKDLDNRIEIETPAKKAISVIVSISIAVFLFLSNNDYCGGVGEFIKKIILSLFGTMGHFFSLAFVCMAILYLFSEKKVSKLKNISLMVAYITLLSLLHLIINDRMVGVSFDQIIGHYIEVGLGEISFSNNSYSGGIVGTVIAEGLVTFFDQGGTTTFLICLFVISLLLFTGIKFYFQFFMFLVSIITFIPKMIIKLSEERKLDREIEEENEEILNNTLRKNNDIKNINNKKIFDGLKNENIFDKEEKNIISTEKIKINPEDIQKRFFHMDQEEENISRNKSDELLNHMKTESVNEIVYNNKDVKPDDFFYDNELYKDRVEDDYDYDVKSDDIDSDNDSDSGLNDENADGGNVDVEYVKSGESDNVSDNINKNFGIQDNKKIYSKQPKINPTVKNDEYKVHIPKKKKSYRTPPIDYLKRNTERTFFDKDLTKSISEKLTETLAQFGVGVVVTDVSIGPTATRYELQPNLGVKVSKVLSLQDDIKLALAASDIRIEAPIPGKSAIGIEVPNKKNVAVLLGDLIANKEFKEQKSALSVCVGKDIGGKNIYCDIDKMPHLLVAGATGSGKSVCINSIIMSIIYRSSPRDVRMILVDPKVVELQCYNDIPHLMIPVVTDPGKANIALNWAVNEMTRRYKVFAEKQVKDLAGYNQLIDLENKNAIYEDSKDEKMARIVIIIDELSDLMMACGKTVENSIVRLAQLSRACGIHLIIATQRPSVNVVTGLIKANVPSRIAFAVSSGVDSRTIIDMNGAEDLLGHGDMLYFPSGSPKPLRVQGCFVSEKEIKDAVDFIKDPDVEYDVSIVKPNSGVADGSGEPYDEKDELFYEAGKLCIETKQPSIGLLQRKFRMGFNRAARVIEQLENEGVLTPQDGKKPRDVIMTFEEFDKKFGK